MVGRDGQEIKTGDVVIIHDDTPRINWKLAVVERLITGLDGITRAPSPDYSHWRLMRTVIKLQTHPQPTPRTK